jgi:hypothetical protein
MMKTAWRAANLGRSRSSGRPERAESRLRAELPAPQPMQSRSPLEKLSGIGLDCPPHGDGPEAGITLIEIVIAVTLLSMLSVGMLMTIRMGLDGLHKTNTRLMENRRVAGAQRLLEQQLGGFMPVKATCSGMAGASSTPFGFFEGQPQSMRLVSTYSLQEAWRGQPRILELQVIPGEEGRGVRLIVNEIPYNGPLSAGQFCLGMGLNPESGVLVPQFGPIQASMQSFVLADKLAWCRFSYLEPGRPPNIDHWRADWVLQRWPIGLRVEMAPLEDNPARLRPLTISTAIPVNRLPAETYAEQ